MNDSEGVMSDYKSRIDNSGDWRELTAVLDELTLELDRGYADPYEDPAHLDRLHDLELLLRYGEQRLEKLLA